MQTIFPILRYTDARAAIRWLCTAFDFREIFTVPETGQFVRHAQLSLGANIIMLGSSRDDGLNSPQKLGAATQALYVHVPGIDEHFEKARSAGAEITAPRMIRTSARASITCEIPKAICGPLKPIFRTAQQPDEASNHRAESSRF